MDGTSVTSPMGDKRSATPKAKRAAKGVTVAYRVAVASRSLAAVFAGYLLASVSSICLAHWLPMARAEAVVTSMMVSFLVYLGAVLWCFACRSALRAWLGVLIPSSVLGAAYCCARWWS